MNPAWVNSALTVKFSEGTAAFFLVELHSYKGYLSACSPGV